MKKPSWRVSNIAVAAELAEAQAKDPLRLLHTYVSEKDLIPADQLESLDESISRAVREAVEFARESPLPEVDSIYDDLWV